VYEITVRQEIDSGHRLHLPYVSPCNRLHGHRFAITVKLRAEQPDATTGITIDFAVVKEAIKYYDHRFFVSERDTLVKTLDVETHGLVVLDCEPTAENIARLLFNQIADRIGQFDNVRVVSVEVCETPTTSVVYRGES
jgi:6-pyruvoyltetrahydropterin/6-carboxytetrahydropterin synthase